MKRNYFFNFAIILALLVTVALLAYSFLEIYPRTGKLPVSQKARANPYLALDRWLRLGGHPVRTVSEGNLAVISDADEQRIFIQASLFQWTAEAVEYLVRLIEGGAVIFLVLDNEAEWDYAVDENLLDLLAEFEIAAQTTWQRDATHEADEDSAMQIDLEEIPDFSRGISFNVSPNADTLILTDYLGQGRLVQVKRGSGRLIVSGKPLFLVSDNLGRAPNARLAWALFAAPDAAAQNGWLFIQGTTRVRGLLGSLFQHGNAAVICVSALVLLVVGFWAVIPRFGIVRRDNEKPGKPLRERFSAEGRFLKRWGALGFYRDIYIKELRRRARKAGLFTDDEIINRVAFILRGTGDERESGLIFRALKKELFTGKEFTKMIITLKTIMERI